MPWRGVCPRDIAISAIAALDCAFRRPRRLQPTTLPLAALWWRHHTTPSREPHERSSYQTPCRHWPQGRVCRLSLPLSHQSAPATPAGAVTGGMRAGPPPNPRRRSNARGASRRPRPSQGAALVERCAPSPRHRRGAWEGRPCVRRARSGPREVDRTGSARHRCARNARSCRRCRSSRASSGGSAAQRRPPESRGRIPDASNPETAGRLAESMLRIDLFPDRWVRVEEVANGHGEPVNCPRSNSR